MRGFIIKHFFPLSHEETERLDRIEKQLNKISLKLDALLKATIPPEQLLALTTEVAALDTKSQALKQALEEQK